MIKVHDGLSSYADVNGLPQVHFRKFRFTVDVEGIDAVAVALTLSEDGMSAQYYLTAERPIAWYSSLDREEERRAVIVFHDGQGGELERLDKTVMIESWETAFSYDDSNVATVRLDFFFV